MNHQAATYFMSRCTKSLDVHLQLASPCFQIYLEIDIDFFSLEFLPKKIKSLLHGIPNKINRLATFCVKFLEHRLWRKQIELSFRFRRAQNETDLWSIFLRGLSRDYVGLPEKVNNLEVCSSKVSFTDNLGFTSG